MCFCPFVLLSFWYEDGCLTEGHTEAFICVKWRLLKFNITILKTVTCLGISNIEEFFKSCNVACFLWIKKRYYANILSILKSMYDLQEYFRFSPKTSTSWKMCVKEQWATESLYQKFSLNSMLCDSRPKRGWNIFETRKSW